MDRPRFIDYYRILGVHRHAEPAVIDAAYRAMSRRYHPDAHGTNHQQRLLNEAYAVLRDPTQRAHYDRLWDAQHAPYDPERQQGIVREAMRTSAPPPAPPPPSRRGLPVFVKFGILAIMIVLGFAAYKEFSNETDPSLGAQSVADNAVERQVVSSSQPTVIPTATPPSRPTPNPCVGWEDSVVQYNKLDQQIRDLHSEAGDDGEYTEQELLDLAATARQIARDLDAANPPEAAQPLYDATHRYVVMMDRMYQATANRSLVSDQVDTLNQLFDEMAEHQAHANDTCL